MSDTAAPILVEVCVGSVADIEAAVSAGAHRLELCSALELGGLTPSLGLVEAALQASPLPIMVMLRPRAGGFCYDRSEFAAMRRDAERFLDLGVHGIVFGTFGPGGQIDRPRCRELVQLAGVAQTVFHRAFDFIGDQRAAIETLIELGCTRVLTSGGKQKAGEGATEIRELVERAAGRIEVLPGGGINAENVVQIVRETGCRQVHVGASIPVDDGSLPQNSGIELCDSRFLCGTVHRRVCGESLHATLAVLRRPTPPR